MACLLDTTWLVEYLRGNEGIVRRIQELEPEGLAVSMVSVAELYEGVFRSSRPKENEQALQDLLSAVSVLDVTQDVARTYGETRASLLRQGKTMGALDLLIAATALVGGLPLATLDEDFQRVEGLTFVSAP